MSDQRAEQVPMRPCGMAHTSRCPYDDLNVPDVEGGGDRSLSATALSADATPAPSADVGPDRLR
jgi:hypothetical protein